MLGRELQVVFVRPGEPAPGLDEHIAGLLGAFDTYDSAMDTTGPARTFGVELTPLESVARGMLAGARG